ncbi:DUF4232 domain-containing protein [Streptomyces sp. NPDC006997]|uniref:DUF4232 domain-containing protein n=1 Tax=Streptomyces sp. NPDC006997 TaxID=3155356 RepID=UPI0033C89F44
MRTAPLTVAALTAAALLLTACSGDGDDGGDDGGNGGSAAGTACSVDGMTIEVGPANAAPAAGDTGNVPVTLTNNGDADCTLEGFPGVELHAEGDSAVLPEEEGAQPQQLTLAKDTAATFTITYVRGAADGTGVLDAAKLGIGLPGGSEEQSFPWSYGAVPVNGEGVPEATVSAFQQAGD